MAASCTHHINFPRMCYSCSYSKFTCFCVLYLCVPSFIPFGLVYIRRLCFYVRFVCVISAENTVFMIQCTQISFRWFLFGLPMRRRYPLVIEIPCNYEWNTIYWTFGWLSCIRFVSRKYGNCDVWQSNNYDTKLISMLKYPGMPWNSMRSIFKKCGASKKITQFSDSWKLWEGKLWFRREILKGKGLYVLYVKPIALTQCWKPQN